MYVCVRVCMYVYVWLCTCVQMDPEMMLASEQKGKNFLEILQATILHKRR